FVKRHEYVATVAFAIDLKPAAYAALVQSDARAAHRLYPIARLLLFQGPRFASVRTGGGHLPVRRSSPVRQSKPPEHCAVWLDSQRIDDLQSACAVRVVADVSEVTLVCAIGDRNAGPVDRDEDVRQVDRSRDGRRCDA